MTTIFTNFDIAFFFFLIVLHVATVTGCLLYDFVYIRNTPITLLLIDLFGYYNWTLRFIDILEYIYGVFWKLRHHES